MDLYKELDREPVRPEPDVWVSRLVIFEKVVPEPVIIQDIPLTRGLNIIVAKEAEDEELPAGITGHSAGKTTFCRFLRYVLGEKTFGRKAVMKLIREAFPGGYVAAQLNIRGRKWAVMRPIGEGRASYAKENASIEDLIRKREHPTSLDLYPNSIGLEDFQKSLEANAIVQTSEPIRWGHVLSWCTRDQETRYQSIHEWRSKRSDSESPGFNQPTEGPLFVMRAVLGLFLPDELKAEQRLTELKREKDRLTRQMDEKRREPEYRVNLFDNDLRQILTTLFPNEPNLDSRPLNSDYLIPQDLTRLTEKAQKKMQDDIEQKKQGISSIQNQIDELGAEKKNVEADLEQQDNIFNLNNATKQEMNVGLTERDKQRKAINDNWDKPCPLGDTLISKCSYVNNRRNILEIKEIQDKKAMEEAIAIRDKEANHIENVKQELRKSIQNKIDMINEAKTLRAELDAEQRVMEVALKDITETFDSLVQWTNMRDKPGGYEELDRLREALKQTEDEIESSENELGGLLHQHNASQKLLASIFSCAVKSVLSSGNYDGKVDFDKRSLRFKLTRGAALAGEAVETLCILLADISCLVFNSLSDSSRLPGLLVHDSPREADLGKRLYGNFIRLVADLQEHFGAADTCPFQYILTTTTPPPVELDKDEFVKLRLNAGNKDSLLLRRNIADNPKPQGNLFA